MEAKWPILFDQLGVPRLTLPWLPKEDWTFTGVLFPTYNNFHCAHNFKGKLDAGHGMYVPEL